MEEINTNKTHSQKKNTKETDKISSHIGKTTAMIQSTTDKVSYLLCHHIYY
jgi:hypothetical protein